MWSFSECWSWTSLNSLQNTNCDSSATKEMTFWFLHMSYFKLQTLVCIESSHIHKPGNCLFLYGCMILTFLLTFSFNLTLNHCFELVNYMYSQLNILSIDTGPSLQYSLQHDNEIYIMWTHAAAQIQTDTQ